MRFGIIGLIVFLLVWIYVLFLLKRAKNAFFFFIAGSVGMFVFLMFTFQGILTDPLTKLVALLSGVFGNLTGFFESLYKYGILFISTQESSMSLYIDYECSGIVEMFAFLSLLWFIPFYAWYEKILYSFFGVFVLILANVLRIIVICTIIHFFGSEAYFVAHTIVGRIIFYGISVALYFLTFTKAQIKRQRVGGFDYDG